MKLTSNAYHREYQDQEVANQTRCFVHPSLSIPEAIYENRIIPMIEVSADINNSNKQIRLNYEKKLINDIKYAAHVRPNGPFYIKPSPMCNPERLGKLLNENLPLTFYEPSFVVEINLVDSEYCRQMHFKEEDQEEVESTWCFWNRLHSAANYNHRIEVSLVLSPDNVVEEKEIARWLGESIYMIVATSDCYQSNSNNYPTFDKFNQLIIRLFMQLCRPVICVEPDNYEDPIVIHYRDFFLFQEKFVKHDNFSPDQDIPRFPLQPLKDDLEYNTYCTFEKDKAKYILYQRAIEEALKDMVPEEEKATRETVVMVVGAGQGPLVRAALNAGVNTERKIKIVIVEKNSNALNILEALLRDRWPNENIELIFGDMRKTAYNGGVDILVSELLGSFGDNELSPECLDGIQYCLKPTGISIPCDSISYLRPVMTKRVNGNILKFFDQRFEGFGDERRYKDSDEDGEKAADDDDNEESQFNEEKQKIRTRKSFKASWLVYFGSVYYIDETKEVFKFEHPNRENPIDNSRHKTLEFSASQECVLNGFAGYFKSKLYKDIELSIHPKTHTKALRSWYSIYFPLPEPFTLAKNDRIELSFSRKVNKRKVWYEYQVTAPKETEIINKDGKNHPIFLQ